MSIWSIFRKPRKPASEVSRERGTRLDSLVVEGKAVLVLRDEMRRAQDAYFAAQDRHEKRIKELA